MIDSPLSSVLSEDCEEEEIWEKEDGDEGGATELEDGDCEELEDKHQDEDDPVIQEDEENFANVPAPPRISSCVSLTPPHATP